MAANPSAKQSKLTLTSIIALSAPSLPMAGIMMPLVIFIPPFFAEQMGLGMAVVGGIFTLGRLFDVITDPVVGSLMDRFQARIPKKLWLVLGAIPLSLATYKIFLQPPESSSMLMMWVLVLYAGWTLMNLGLYSWGAEVTEDYHQRSRVMGAIQISNSVGSVGVLLVPALIEILGIDGDVSILRIQAMGVFILCMLPLSLLVAWFFAPESQPTTEQQTPILPALKTALRSRATLMLLIADLAVGLKIGLMTSMSVFLIEIVFKLEGSAGTLQLAMLLSGLIGLPFFVVAARRLEKHRALALTVVFTGGGALGLLFMPIENYNLTLVAFLFFGLGTAASQMFPRAIMADVVDEHQAISGDKNTGVFFSFLTTTLKVGLALGVGLGYGVANLVGFDPASARLDDSTHHALRYIVVFGELIFGGLIVVIMWRFPLGQQQQERLRQQIQKSAESG